MVNINPGSEDFFYWDPEQLQDYQETERNTEPNATVVNSALNKVQDSNDFLTSITTIIRNKGVA